MQVIDVAKIPAGAYDVGDDSIPHAGPRHRRRIGSDYWIDLRPISGAHFEIFVANGGYSNPEFWTTRDGNPINPPPIDSVDSRCLEIMGSSASWRNSFV